MLKRNVASMIVCSDEFEALGRAEATAYGYGDLPIFTVPHPFGVLPEETVLTEAEERAQDVLQTLEQKQKPVPGTA